ncbi:hypothetical protein K432DRAFT_398343 [Lepidopterella palustris CBS 459.81]|uniref:Uncharacterized protein n=1 Tax=Lepidopterella palustris CBS 459.81 TaxID=1314670 RepID=A0A8E2DYM5_9PEZI|nr:hypothetical protein K432DRAFT_398343 [Lepidopterella palustris CBS 459.81]
MFARVWTLDFYVPLLKARYAYKNYDENDPFDQALERFYIIANSNNIEIRRNIMDWAKEKYGRGPVNTLLGPQFKCILDLGRKIEEYLLKGDLKMEDSKKWLCWNRCSLWLKKMVDIRKSNEQQWELEWEKKIEEERRVIEMERAKEEQRRVKEMRRRAKEKQRRDTEMRRRARER